MTTMWRRIRALVIKEFLALLKDKKSRFVVFVPPVVQLFVFSYAATFDLNHIPLAVYNEDRGPAARELVARFRGSPHFHEAKTIENSGEIAPLIDGREVLMLLHIDPRFSRRLQQGRTATVQVIVDGRDSNT